MTIKDEYLKYCVECCHSLNWNIKLSGNVSVTNKLHPCSLVLTSFAVISSLLSDTAINQNGGNSFEFQSNMKQKILDQNLKRFCRNA